MFFKKSYLSSVSRADCYLQPETQIEQSSQSFQVPIRSHQDYVAHDIAFPCQAQNCSHHRLWHMTFKKKAKTNGNYEESQNR